MEYFKRGETLFYHELFATGVGYYDMQASTFICKRIIRFHFAYGEGDVSKILEEYDPTFL